MTNRTLLQRAASLSPAAAQIVWIALLILPAATTLSAWHSWDLDPYHLFAASFWLVIVLRLSMPGAWFFPLTYPIALFALVCVGADIARNVDLLELAAQWHTFSASDVSAALRPYRLLVPVAAAVLGLLCWLGVRLSAAAPAMSMRWRVAAVLAGSGLLFALTPVAVWARAWPVNGLLIALSIAADAPTVAMYSTQAIGTNPRSPSATWQASRAAAGAQRETFVLVIGETVRSDYLRECGGANAVRPVAAGALVACDVSAGSNATHTSVPLLVSRELPGHRVRVSDDATFQKAFAEVGMSTHWYGVQGDAIAWPDAGTQAFPSGPDRPALLPLFDKVLSGQDRSSSIVLHLYGAHEPYCARFDRRNAPNADECDRLGDSPSAASIGRWRAMYANAVDDSIGFVNELIARLERSPGQVFLVYTPDHGENLLDDRRQLYGHALRHPTRWDTRVPAVFWANDAWKQAHPDQWATLQRNAGAALMHADMVPTLLGAAGIQYLEPRATAVNLLEREVPARRRLVQTSIGAATDWEALVHEAR